ncbi:DNA helicase PIF1, ATP-dependent [Corchorus olitorius]|uniref:ATP-dependent DNA helicase n=1 Tax=Corchorus olitorius TaxID=93759 RepID=A0A1R3H4K1_9ROSI|nr:DNA helicase PIF1, ATP-dependent [Corchorus olitorius]
MDTSMYTPVDFDPVTPPLTSRPSKRRCTLAHFAHDGPLSPSDVRLLDVPITCSYDQSSLLSVHPHVSVLGTNLAALGHLDAADGSCYVNVPVVQSTKLSFGCSSQLGPKCLCLPEPSGQTIGSLLVKSPSPPLAPSVLSQCRALDDSSLYDVTVTQTFDSAVFASTRVVKLFRTAKERIDADGSKAVRIRLIRSRGSNPRTYSFPTSTQIGGLIVGDYGRAQGDRDVIVHHKDHRLEHISTVHPLYMSLQYPILFPYGEDGFIPHIKYVDSPVKQQTVRKTMSMREYYAYQLQQRNRKGEILLRGGRLFQQYCVDAYSSVQEGELLWLNNHQTEIFADMYTNVRDVVHRVTYTVEFQKRGLPHAHILLWLQQSSKFKSPSDINRFVSAEIPDKDLDPIGYEAVTSLMMHGPCGPSKPRAPCMEGGRCTLLTVGVTLVLHVLKGLLSWTTGTCVLMRLAGGCFLLISTFGNQLLFNFWSIFVVAIMFTSKPNLLLGQSSRPNVEKTMFTEWMVANSVYADARQLLYADFPSKFVWHANLKKWEPRRRGKCIGRVVQINALAGELYYLRLILNVMRGPRNYDEIRIVSGVLYPTFQAVATPLTLFEQHWKMMAEDIKHRFKKVMQGPSAVMSEADLWDRLLIKIDDILHRYGSSLAEKNLPLPRANSASYREDRLLLEEMSYARDELERDRQSYVNSLNSQQASIYNAIMASVVASDPKWSTCDIFKWTQLARLIQSTKIIVWDEAPMMHRHCIEAVDRSLRDVCGSVKPELRNKSFGGITVIFGGDLRQILPVIPGASRTDVVAFSICHSPIWPGCRVLHLTVNMRLLRSDVDPHSRRDLQDFASWLISIGDGTVPHVRPSNDTPGWIQIPDDLLVPFHDDPIQAIIQEIFPDFGNYYADCSYLGQRAIITPVNLMVNRINAAVLELIPGPVMEYYSSDQTSDASPTNTGENVYPVELLNTITSPGVPGHRLSLKKGCVVMMLRNVNQRVGLCNGTRLIVVSLGSNVIEAKIISGDHIEVRVFIPRIVFVVENKQWPFVLVLLMLNVLAITPPCFSSSKLKQVNQRRGDSVLESSSTVNKQQEYREEELQSRKKSQCTKE